MKLSTNILSIIAKNWPFSNGVGRFIDNFSDNKSLGNGVRECRTSDGFNLDVYENDHIGRHVILSGQFDRAPAQVLIDFANEGDVVLDIGANIGYVSCCILHNVPGSTIICVEPQPDIADLLLSNLSRFSPERSSVFQVALSDREGEVLLNINTANRGASSIHCPSDGGTISVRTMSADDLLGKMEKLDLIKIDVEGHEEAILLDAQNQIKRLRPRAIQFEDRESKADPQGSIGSIFQSMDYQIYAIKKSVFRTTLLPVNSKLDCTATDYVAISNTANLVIPSKYN